MIKAYTLYCLDELGRIHLPERIAARTDEDAISRARAMTPGARIREIWFNNRLVARTKNDLVVA